MSAEPRRAQIRSIERAAAILRVLAATSRGIGMRASPGAGVAELSRELQLSRATVHAILRTLEFEGFVERDSDSGRYRIGETLLPIGFSYLEACALRMAALNAAYALSAKTGEGVRVGTLHGSRVLIVHHLTRRNSSHEPLDVGGLVPVHATALGKALLAHDRDLLTELAAVGLVRFTHATRTDPARFQQELDEVRSRGWSTEIGELSRGVGSIAAPIVAETLSKPGAIGIEGSIDQLFEDGSPRIDLVGAVVESARSVTRELGEHPWSA